MASSERPVWGKRASTLSSEAPGPATTRYSSRGPASRTSFPIVTWAEQTSAAKPARTAEREVTPQAYLRRACYSHPRTGVGEPREEALDVETRLEAGSGPGGAGHDHARTGGRGDRADGMADPRRGLRLRRHLQLRRDHLLHQ